MLCSIKLSYNFRVKTPFPPTQGVLDPPMTTGNTHLQVQYELSCVLVATRSESLSSTEQAAPTLIQLSKCDFLLGSIAARVNNSRLKLYFAR